MSETVRDLYGFLHPEITPEKEVIVSARFKGKDGKPVPFVIRPLEQEVCDKVQRTCVKTDKKGNSEFDRFKYVDELTRMGANIKVESNIAIINGVTRYTGARVNAPDLRAGAALVIAGLVAEGITVIDDIYFIERGYEEFDQKLRGIGAQIEKVSDEKEIQKFILKVS